MKKIKIFKIKIAEAGCEEKRQKHSRIYIFEKSKTEWSVADYRRQVLPRVLKQMGSAECSVTWNRFAGCQCGCSPGFIVKDARARNAFVEIY